MTDLPPPPPPASVVPPMPPPGYVGYAPHPAAPQPTAGLRKAMLILYWITSAFAVLAGIAMLARKGTWDDLFAGTADFEDVDNADGMVVLTVLVGCATLIAGFVLTILLLNRRKANSGAADGRSTSKPFAVWWVAFSLGFVLLIVGRVVGDIDEADAFANAEFISDVSDKLQNQSILTLLGAALYVVATVFAARTTKDLARN
jgi:NADH:ubiquinone oxidoreductase subunit 5 (subunit L)/multisubunit Na+/H+ antiporter MnhA subunit